MVELEELYIFEHKDNPICKAEIIKERDYHVSMLIVPVILRRKRNINPLFTFAIHHGLLSDPARLKARGFFKYYTMIHPTASTVIKP